MAKENKKPKRESGLSDMINTAFIIMFIIVTIMTLNNTFRGYEAKDYVEECYKFETHETYEFIDSEEIYGAIDVMGNIDYSDYIYENNCSLSKILDSSINGIKYLYYNCSIEPYIQYYNETRCVQNHLVKDVDYFINKVEITI